MNKRGAMATAFEGRPPAEAVPIWEIEFHAWEAASGKHVVLGHEFEALTEDQQERAMYANAEIMLSVCDQMEHAALTVPGGYWNQAPGQLAYYCLPGQTRFRQATILREHAPSDLMLIAGAGGIIQADYSPEFCYRIFDDPASVDELVRQRLSQGVETAKRFRDCGVEAVFSASDVADNSGPFFNPEQMDRWILSALETWSAAIRDMGLYSILHSDGDLTRYVDAIASTGVDALQAVDPVAGMDMRKAKDVAAGRLCLCGNVDCGLLLTGEPDDVYAATGEMLTCCKPGGSLILGASNAVQLEVPIDNYRAMIRAWKRFGQYND